MPCLSRPIAVGSSSGVEPYGRGSPPDTASMPAEPAASPRGRFVGGGHASPAAARRRGPPASRRRATTPWRCSRIRRRLVAAAAGEPATSSIDGAPHRTERRAGAPACGDRACARLISSVHDGDPRLLRPFVALADELHFGRAAERLHVTQPALSQQIARLERQLGVRCSTARARRVELTEARRGDAAGGPHRRRGRRGGRGVAAQPRPRRARRAAARPVAGRALRRPAAARRVRARRGPRVRVRARQDSSGALAEQVADGRARAGARLLHRAARRRRAARGSRDEPVVVAVPAGHPLARAAPSRSPTWRTRRSRSSTPHDGAGYNRAVPRSAAPPASSRARGPTRTGRWRGRRRCAASAASA